MVSTSWDIINIITTHSLNVSGPFWAFGIHQQTKETRILVLSWATCIVCPNVIITMEMRYIYGASRNWRIESVEFYSNFCVCVVSTMLLSYAFCSAVSAPCYRGKALSSWRPTFQSTLSKAHRNCNSACFCRGPAEHTRGFLPPRLSFPKKSRLFLGMFSVKSSPSVNLPLRDMVAPGFLGNP